LADIDRPFDEPLPEPTAVTAQLTFDRPGEMAAIRGRIERAAASHGLAPARIRDLTLAVSELVANTIRHAGGTGTVRVWSDGDSLVCEVRDAGQIRDPLVGRRRTASAMSGHGLWLVNQLCDLVQVRAFPDGSVVRLHMSGRARGARRPSRPGAVSDGGAGFDRPVPRYYPS
jgi:anti-sigma regulatory factor (Ser/Thr protein kinase)